MTVAMERYPSVETTTTTNDVSDDPYVHYV